jgi:hypothetical protein
LFLLLQAHFLSLVYLLLIDALAGAIPVIFELAGCLITLSLKLAYDHTAWGKQQQLQQAAALQEQIVEALCAIEEEQDEQEGCSFDQQQQQLLQQQFHRDSQLLAEKQLAGQQKVADDSSSHSTFSISSNSERQQQQQPQQQQQQQHNEYATKVNLDIDEPYYREEPGFSSDVGAATAGIQLSPKTAAATTGKVGSGQPASPADIKMMIYQNPLARGESAAGTAVSNSAASSTNGSAAAGSKSSAAAAAVFGKQSSSGSRKRPAVLSSTGTSLGGGGTASATAALAVALQQLQQQQQRQQPWYMRTGIRHGASIPTSSSGQLVLPSGGSGVLLERHQTTANEQRCCQCCHVCGAQQLPQPQQHTAAAGAASRSSSAGRASLFGAANLAAILASGNSISARVGAAGRRNSSSQGVDHRGQTNAQVMGQSLVKDSNTKLTKRTSLDIPRNANASVWQLEQQPEQSSASLSSLGRAAEVRQAMRRRSIMLLSLSGGSSSGRGKAGKAPASNMQQQQQELNMRPAVPVATGTDVAPAAAVLQINSAQKKKQPLTAVSSRHVKLQPALPVIRS